MQDVRKKRILQVWCTDECVVLLVKNVALLVQRRGYASYEVSWEN